MADWNLPQLGTPYADVLQIHLAGKDVDAITLQKSAPSNLPDGAMAYDRSTDLFKEWNASTLAFVVKKLSILGGGTGADNVAQARINLGLGSMATQDSTAVTITGGSISGVTLDAAAITSGIIALSRGGTGANLVLGTSGKVLQSDGVGVVFGTDGSQLSNLNASNISSGTIPLARLPTGFGKIAQAIYGTTTSAYSITSSYASVTGHTIIITPIYNTSTVRVSFLVNCELGINAGFAGQIGLRVKRNGTVVYTRSNAFYLNPTIATSMYAIVPIDFVDSPASTSALTYQLEAIVTTSSGYGAINTAASTETMFATELTA